MSYGYRYALYDGAQTCVVSSGLFGQTMGLGKTSNARLVLCNADGATTTPMALRDEALGFLRGVRKR